MNWEKHFSNCIKSLRSKNNEGRLFQDLYFRTISFFSLQLSWHQGTNTFTNSSIALRYRKFHSSFDFGKFKRSHVHCKIFQISMPPNFRGTRDNFLSTYISTIIMTQPVPQGWLALYLLIWFVHRVHVPPITSTWILWSYLWRLVGPVCKSHRI